MRSRRMRPLDLSSSYFTLEPKGISTTQSNSWGSLSPGVTSCQGWFINFNSNGTVKQSSYVAAFEQSCSLAYALGWFSGRSLRQAQGRLFATPEKRLCSG